MRTRIFVVNQWLPPDPAPTAVLCGEVIAMLVDAGYECVLLSRQRAGIANAEQPGIRQVVIDSVAQGTTGISAKLAAWPSFAWRAWRVLRRELRAGDVLLVCSDPPLFYPLALATARSVGAHGVHWSQDVYPDVLQRYWPRRWLKLALAPLRYWRNAALRRAGQVVAISAGMTALMQSVGARTTLIPNWARDDRLRARALGDSDLRRQHYAESDFVLAYSGNLGRVHEFATLLGAAQILRDESAIKFLIVGSGPRLGALRAQVQSAGLSAFRFLPLQPEAQLNDTLAVGDMHLVSLLPQFEGLVLPSKVYSIAAVGRGVLFCGDAGGETAQLIAQHRCGVAVSVGDAAGLASAIRSLAADRARCAALGKQARAMIDGTHSRAKALIQWRQLIDALATPR